LAKRPALKQTGRKLRLFFHIPDTKRNIAVVEIKLAFSPNQET
jgi:hypothetical protein